MTEHRPVRFGDRCYGPKGGRCHGTIRTVEQVTGHQSVKHPGWPMCDSCRALFRPDGWFAGSSWEYTDSVPPYALGGRKPAPGRGPAVAGGGCSVGDVEW